MCELAYALAVPQPRVSRHLAHLREAGLVADRRAGQWIYYRLHPDLPPWQGRVLVEAVATAIALFGFQSGAALATVVGVLVEVPLMLAVVKVVNATRAWYEAAPRVVPTEVCCPPDLHVHRGH